MRGDFSQYIRQMMQDGSTPKPEPAPTPPLDMKSLAANGDPQLAGSLPLILAVLEQAMQQGAQGNRQPITARRTGGQGNGSGLDVGDMVDYMNYDGDPNMGLLKGLFGGRAQPGTPSWKFEEGLGRRGRGR